jgi:hypothetical protein
LRSTPIRLRRELQHIGFLTPIEIEHAIFTAGEDRKAIESALLAEGYQQAEIDRSIANAVSRGLLIKPDDDHLAIHSGRRTQARRYLLLDLAVIRGKSIAKNDSSQAGYVLVPGNGPFHGIRAADLLTDAKSVAASLVGDWPSYADFKADIDWLARRGYMILNEGIW